MPRGSAALVDSRPGPRLDSDCGSPANILLRWLSPLDLSPDEAHYWDWSRTRLEPLQQGPGVAYLIHASCCCSAIFRKPDRQHDACRPPARHRLEFLLVSLYTYLQIFRRESLALGVVVLGLTMPIFALGSSP